MAIVIHPGQHIVTVDSPGARQKINKASLDLALFAGLGNNDGSDYVPVHYLITGPIKGRPEGIEKPELQGAKDNEIELEPGVYLEVEK